MPLPGGKSLELPDSFRYTSKRGLGNCAQPARHSAPGHQKEAVMDFAWFFAGILGVAIALRYIKGTTPNDSHHH